MGKPSVKFYQVCRSAAMKEGPICVSNDKRARKHYSSYFEALWLILNGAVVISLAFDMAIQGLPV